MCPHDPRRSSDRRRPAAARSPIAQLAGDSEKARALYLGLYANHPSAIVILTADGQSVLDANPAAGILFGQPCQALYGRPVDALMPDLTAEHLAALTAALPEQSVAARIYRTRLIDQDQDRDIMIQSVTLDLHGIAHPYLVINDMSTGCSEKGLSDTPERLLRSVFEATPDLVVLIDRQFRIRLSNWKGREFVPPVLRRSSPPCYQAFMGRDAPCEPCFAKEVFRTGEPKIYERFNPDPRVGHIEVSAYPICDESGKVALVCEHVRTINDRKQAEKDREQLQRQLHQAQKMEAIGTLAGGIAHDFNNLMMAMLGNVSLMRNELGDSFQFADTLKSIEEYIQRGTALTDQLLGFARGGKYQAAPADINDLLGQSAGLFGRTKKEVTITKDLYDPIWTVEIDRNQLEQVFLNLFVNAWQAMPQGGKLHLATANVTLDKDTGALKSIPAGRYVRITVADSGTGMTEEVSRRIFDPFFTTRDRQRGTGLGLASAYGIIKNHNGCIEVDSAPGRGTTFIIHLPAFDGVKKAIRPAARKTAQRQPTVLLVDDELMVLEVGRKMLAALGYGVVTAQGGAQAMEELAQGHNSIDLVMLDMIMPEMSGSETFDRIRSAYPLIKVILSSGYSLDGDAKDIMARGCNGFIQKPFNLQDLSEKIHQVLHGGD